MATMSDMMSMISKLPERFGGLLAQAFLRESARGQTGRTILSGTIFVADDLHMGAFVEWQEKKPSYVFTIGMALALADAAIELVCTPTFMKDIGAPNLVQAHPQFLTPRIRFQDYSNHSIEAYCAAWPFSKKPIDEARITLAFDLFDLSTKYISLHEQGHYLSGHLDLVRSTWTEIGTHQHTGIDPRVMEMQADTFAAQVLTNHKIHIHHKLGPISDNAALTSYVLRCITVSMALVCSVLEINDRGVGRMSGVPTHPSAGARLLNVLRFAALAQSTDTQPHERGVWGSLDVEKFFEDPIAVLNILGVQPVSEPDLVSFVEGIEAPDAPRASEAFQLLGGVPEARRVLADHAGEALHRLSVAAADSGPKLSEGIRKHLKGQQQYDQFGQMTPYQYMLYLMEAVARSGKHIPWNLMLSDDFFTECVLRGEKYLRAKHPGVFFTERSD